MNASKHEGIGTTRLEAFSDGVIAIIITIMVLELRPPHDPSLGALVPLWPVFLSYALSFLYVGIYWNNHHHMLHATHRVSGAILWANLHLLFWLSLTPFTTAWMGENYFASTPTAVYGVVLLCTGFAYRLLQREIIQVQGPDSLLARAIGSDRKGRASLLGYGVGIPMAYVSRSVALALYVAVAAIWLVPDKRIEREMEAAGRADDGGVKL